MAAPPRGGGADMEGVRPGTSGSVCVSRDVSLSTLVLPHASSSFRTGRDDADVAEASSVCIFPDCSAPGSPGESSPGPGSNTSHCPAVAGQRMIPRYKIPSRRASTGALHQAGGSIFHPQPELWKLWAWPLKGAHLIDSGLSTEVVETILHPRAPSSSISDCGPGKAQFALPSAGIRCICPQSYPVA